MKTALITGANRGLGLEFVHQLKAKGFQVIATCRHPEQATALHPLVDELFQLDVTSDEQINTLKQNLKNKPIDLLINNAGIIGEQGVTLGNIDRANFLHVINTNCLSVVKLSDALLPNLEASKDKYILVISSRMGSIADNERGRTYAYRASKAALNCVMRSFAIDVKDKGVKVMLIHPGWVKTDMGGQDAPTDIPTSVTGMLEQARLHFAQSHAEILRSFDGETFAW